MKKIVFSIFAIIISIAALLIYKSSIDKVDSLSMEVDDFFPKQVMTKKFSGGFENEGFTHTIDKIENGKLQIKQTDSAMPTILVYEISKESIKLIYSQEIHDIKFGENYIENIESNRKDIIIKAPIKKGTKWTDEEGKYEITGVDVEITTPAGDFNTLEVTFTRNDFEVKRYYAKDIGLVKSIIDGLEDELIEIKYSVEEENSSDFAVKVKEKYISVRENYNNLNDILGVPISEEIEILGDGADTFKGSRIKTLTYDGLIIEEISPEKSGNDSFWILSMTITNKKYSTKKGLTIGNKLEKIKELYGNIEILKDGRTDSNNCAYIFKDDMKPNFIVFEVKDGVIDEIKIYYELQ